MLPQEAPVPAPGQPAEKSDFPKFEEIVKGMDVVNPDRKGYYTLYVKENRVFAEIPADKLEKPFLLATSFARGSYSGWMWDDILVQWQRVDKKILLIEPDVRHRVRDDDPLAASVKRNYTESIVANADILTLSPQGAPVIDLFGLLTQRAHVFLGSGLFGFFMRGGMDPSLAKVYKLKVFPGNVEIAVDLPGQERGPITTVHFSFSELKETGYRPREADDRVGYFLTSVKDYSKSAREDTRFVRYVNRWNIQKADPKLKLSPPREPIVFYVEKTVPVQYRRAVREGILEWNKAFEQIGISEALVVRQQTENNEFASLDPEDVRFNFFRWITSDRAFAMGPSRVDPRTGQILDADIIFDDAMIRAFLQDHRLLIGETARARLSPALREYLNHNPQANPLRHELKGSPEERERALAALKEREAVGLLDGDGRKACAVGRGLLQQMALARIAGLAPAGEESYDNWPEEFVNQVVKEIVMHEVGHTIGLRHNFKASSWRGLDEINGDGTPPDTSGSVMDYNPLNLATDGKKQGSYVPRTLGPYDVWAVEYGYKPIDAGAPEQERAELAQITRRVAEAGLAYGTDEDLASSDPHIQLWDLGNDPIAYNVERMKLVGQIQEKLIDRAVKPGDSYAKARRAFMTLLMEREECEARAARFIGGHYTARDHRGDPDERAPVRPVDVQKQREALAFLRDNLFSDEAFRFSPEFLNQLGASRWSDWGFEFDSRVEFPIHDMILSVQSWGLFDLLNPMTLQRVLDAELRVPADQDAMTLPELFGTLTKDICTEILAGPRAGGGYTERKPFLSSVRRNLQREYIARLIGITLEKESGFLNTPRPARTIAWHELKQLGASLDEVLKNPTGLDRYSLAHLEETRQRVRRALEASFSIGGDDG
jgi:hypothetical protein